MFVTDFWFSHGVQPCEIKREYGESYYLKIIPELSPQL